MRGFARHRSATDSRTEIPPIGLLPHRSTRARPHLYTEEEIRRLLDAALELPVAWPSTPLRPWVFHGLIGLLSVTGLRLSEALNLELADVDLDQAVLTIRGAKFGQWRLVPIHSSTGAVLADYLKRREQFFRHPVSSYRVRHALRQSPRQRPRSSNVLHVVAQHGLARGRREQGAAAA